MIVGSLRIRVSDLAVATSLAEIWARASWTAQAIWSTSLRIDRIKVAKATRRRGLPGIAQEGLPPTL